MPFLILAMTVGFHKHQKICFVLYGSNQIQHSTKALNIRTAQHLAQVFARSCVQPMYPLGYAKSCLQILLLAGVLVLLAQVM
jgi:hypothetical protein